MWEAIQSNIQRSRLLIVLMGVLLVLLGAAIGAAQGGGIEFAAAGAVAALALWLLLLTVALTSGEQLLLTTAGAKKIEKEDSPILWNVVEEMTIAAGLGQMPSIHIIDNDLPNAFAAGRKPEKSVVAVTTGLLKRLNRDELQGVIAHEIAHIRNYDIRFLTIATVMVGSIVLISDIFLRSLWWGGGRRRGTSKGGDWAAIGALVLAVAAPIFANILYYSVSRQREYLADASAARFTRYPQGLASALRKIATAAQERPKHVSFSRALAPMFIINPLQAKGATAGLFSTHPPTERRIAVLEAMSGGAGWLDYEAAYKQVTGDGCLSSTVLSSEGSVPMREATAETNPKQAAIDRSRSVTDLLDRFAGMLLIPCVCGVRMKAPEGTTASKIACPSCGKQHPIPRADGASAPESSDQSAANEGPLVYERQSDDWESFACSCGQTQQLSPALRVAQIRCRRCEREIRIQ